MADAADFVSPSLLAPALRRDLSLRAQESIAARLGQLDLTPVLVYDFDHCPAAALPALAEQYNLLGDAGWDMAEFSHAPELAKRALLKEAVALHRIKGTRYAVQRALDLLSVQSHITEWWQTTPPGAPYTFALDLLLTDGSDGRPILNAERVAAVLRMVQYWKPERAKFRARLGVGLEATTRVATITRPMVLAQLDLRAVTRHQADATHRTAVVVRPLQRVSLALRPQ